MARETRRHFIPPPLGIGRPSSATPSFLPSLTSPHGQPAGNCLQVQLSGRCLVGQRSESDQLATPPLSAGPPSTSSFSQPARPSASSTGLPLASSVGWTMVRLLHAAEKEPCGIVFGPGPEILSETVSPLSGKFSCGGFALASHRHRPQQRPPRGCEAQQPISSHPYESAACMPPLCVLILREMEPLGP